MPNELNPNHPMTEGVRDQWHKIVALLVERTPEKHVVITTADIQRLPLDSAVVVEDRMDGLHVYLVGMDEARKLAREAGGLPT